MYPAVSHRCDKLNGIKYIGPTRRIFKTSQRALLLGWCPSNINRRNSVMIDRMYDFRMPFLGRVFAATPNHDGRPDTSRWLTCEWDRGELVIYLGANWWCTWTPSRRLRRAIS